MRRGLGFALAVLASLAIWAWLIAPWFIARAWADTASDIGTGYTSSNPTGEMSAEIVSTRDNNVRTTPVRNYVSLMENHVNLATDPTCALSGVADALTLLDASETDNTYDYRFCLGTSDFYVLPNTGSDKVANAELLVGTGANTAAYVAMSGDVAIANTGATTIQADSVALGTDTTGSYAAGDAEAGNATGLACTDCVTLGTETAGNYVLSVTASTGLSSSGCTAAEGATCTLSATLGTAIDSTEITDGTVAYADVDATDTLSTAARGVNAVWFATTGLIFEGSTDSVETLLTAADPTSTDKTITLPNETGTVCTTGSVCTGYQAGPLSGDVVTSGAAATIQANSVALGTDTTGSYAAGDAEAGNATGVACTDCIALGTETTGNYVTSVTAGTGLTSSGCTAGEGATCTVSANLAASDMPSGTNTSTWTIDADNTGGTEPANGAGIKIEGGSGDVTLLYDDSANELDVSVPISGSLAGNATTATALASNPTETGCDSATATFATAIDASGNLTCNQVNLANTTGTLGVARLNADYGDFTCNATTCTLDTGPAFTTSTTYTIDSDNGGTEPANGAGLVIEGGSGTNITATYDSTGNDLEFAGAAGGYTFDGPVSWTASDGSRVFTFQDNTSEPGAASSGYTNLWSLGGELYKKDSGDGTNERLILTTGNVTGDITCAAPSSGTTTCSIGASAVTATALAADSVGASELIESMAPTALTGDWQWNSNVGIVLGSSSVWRLKSDNTDVILDRLSGSGVVDLGNVGTSDTGVVWTGNSDASDGSDNTYVDITGTGTSADTTRSANVRLFGNEVTLFGGSVGINAGNVSTGAVTIGTGGATRFQAQYDGEMNLVGNTRVGGSAGDTPSARLDVQVAAVATAVQALQSVATNDDPIERFVQLRGATTDGSATSIGTVFTATASTAQTVDCVILARRTGGVSGATDDMASYRKRADFKGTAQLGATQTIGTDNESQAGWDATIDVSAAAVRVVVTGAASNNVTWHAHCRYYAMAS